MRDLIRCNNCQFVTSEEEARDWWTVSRLFPIPRYGEEPEAWDFCTEKCFQQWMAKRRSVIQ